MAIAPVLKTGARKGLGVRIPHPPSRNVLCAGCGRPSAGSEQTRSLQRRSANHNDKRPALERGPLAFRNDKAIGLVERYCEPYLSNIRVCIRIPHREATPVRREACIASHPNIVANPEKHSAARL